MRWVLRYHFQLSLDLFDFIPDFPRALNLPSDSRCVLLGSLTRTRNSVQVLEKNVTFWWWVFLQAPTARWRRQVHQNKQQMSHFFFKNFLQGFLKFINFFLASHNIKSDHRQVKKTFCIIENDQKNCKSYVSLELTIWLFSEVTSSRWQEENNWLLFLVTDIDNQGQSFF